MEVAILEEVQTQHQWLFLTHNSFWTVNIWWIGTEDTVELNLAIKAFHQHCWSLNCFCHGQKKKKKYHPKQTNFVACLLYERVI